MLFRSRAPKAFCLNPLTPSIPPTEPPSVPWGSAILQPHEDPQSPDPTRFNAPHRSCSPCHNFTSTAHHYNRAFTNTLSPSPGKAPTLALAPAWPASPQGHAVGLTVRGTAPASRGAQQAPRPDDRLFLSPLKLSDLHHILDRKSTRLNSSH